MKPIRLEDALVHLQKRGVHDVSMMNFLKLNPVEKLLEADGAILGEYLAGDNKHWTIISAESPQQLEELRPVFHQHRRYVIEDWMHPEITKGRELLWDELCFTFYVPDHVQFPRVEPLPEIPEDCIELIKTQWSYQEDWALAFIKNCLKQGVSSIKYVEGKPVAWASVQDDGALGFMHVLPEYRKHGYAKEVTIDLIRKVRERGDVPFVHIAHTNQASQHLVKSMGFELLKKIYWLEVK